MEPKPTTRGRDLDHVAWLYDPIIEGLSFGRERRFREMTLDTLSFSPAAQVLDVGCGTGSLTLLLAQRLSPPGAAVGIDAAPKMIAIARRKASRQALPARFDTGLAEALPYADESFDLVVNSMFTHHIDTELKRRAFAEMYRVLRPGGELVTADVDRPTSWSGWLLGWGARWLLLQRELLDNLRGDLPELMQAAGFAGVRRVGHVYGLVSFFKAQRPASGANP